MKKYLVILIFLFASCKEKKNISGGGLANGKIMYADTSYVGISTRSKYICDTVYIHDTIYSDDINIGSMQGDIITGTKNVKK